MAGDIDRIKAILEANKKMNFIQRILNPYDYPSLDLGNGYYATHLMSSASIDGRNIVYPNVIQGINGKLIKLEGRNAIDYALSHGEFIEFPTQEEAQWFGENYKKVWDIKKEAKTPSVRNRVKK